jgi:hypothetical protein
MYNSIMDANLTLKHRIDATFFEIISCDPMQRRDLQRMWRVARSKWNELDIELIQCRRQKKATPKYQEIEADIIERVETIEKYLTFALLTK